VPRDLAAEGPAATHAATLSDTAKILAAARVDGELLRQLMAMPALERIEAALDDLRFHRPTLARMLALQAESALGDPACDPRPVAELGAAIAGTLARNPGGEAQSTAAWAYWLLGKAMLGASQWRLADDAFQSISAFIPRPSLASEAEAFACLGFAQLHEDLGHEQQAGALFLRAAYLHAKRGDLRREAACQAQLGLQLHRSGDVESGLRPLRAALRLFDAAFAPSLAARLRLVLAEIETVLGNAAAARKQLRLARKLYKLAPSPAEAIELRWSKARIAAAAGENDMAEVLIERVRRELLDSGSLDEAARCSCDQLLIQVESRRFDAADQLAVDLARAFPPAGEPWAPELAALARLAVEEPGACYPASYALRRRLRRPEIASLGRPALLVPARVLADRLFCGYGETRGSDRCCRRPVVAVPRVRADNRASQDIGDVLPALSARLRRRFGGVLYSYRIPADDGEDVVQTTLLLAVAKWSDIRDPEAWLVGTLRKRCILYWRTRRSHMEYTQPIEEMDRAYYVEPDQTRRELFADLGKVWHHLPPTQRKLLVLRFREGMSPQEAAQEVGLAHTSVRKTTNRAFERLREVLGMVPPPSRSPRPPRAPRLQSAALTKRLRAKGDAGAAWITAVEAFAAVKAQHLRAQLLRYVAAAGIALGPPRLAELNIEDLAAFRLALGEKSPALRAPILYSLRSFLLWAGERGDHVLHPDAVRQALRVGKTIQREPAGKGATAEWSAAVETFLAASTVTATTRQQYRCHLLIAGAALGWRPLAELTDSDLLAFRAALLADGRAAGTHLCALLAVRSFLVWAREQSWLAIDRQVIRAVLQGWDSRRDGPPTPAGSGRATLPATPLERERPAPEIPAAPIAIVAPKRGRQLAPKDPSATAVVEASGQAGSVRASSGDPGGRPMPTCPSPGARPAAQPAGRVKLVAAAHPKRAVRPPRVGALWKTEVEAYLASFASSEHDTYRCHLLKVGLALAEVDFPQLTAAHLAAYRERLRADGRSQRVHLQALSVLRSFLVWAGARSVHQLGAFEVIAALPLPPIADEDFTRVFVAHFSESLAAGRGTHGGWA
jgi:RNA polymerase sigma factor (sigma-70 family)